MSLIPATHYKTQYDYSADVEVMKDFLNKTKGPPISETDLLDGNEEELENHQDFEMELDGSIDRSNQRYSFCDD